MDSHTDRVFRVGLHDRIVENSCVMPGKPIINGTREIVELILRKLGEGASESARMDEYPQLSSDDIRAAIRFAADTIALEEVSTSRGASSALGVRLLADAPHGDANAADTASGQL